MTIFGQSGKRSGRAIGAGLLMGFGLLLGSCTPGEFSIGSRTLSFGGPAEPVQAGLPMTPPAMPMPTGPGESFGRGPVRVALLLPLSGDPALNAVGASLANASKLAMSFIEANPNIAENITISLKDTGPSPGGAAQAASQAMSEGASLILGPLRADQVMAAGSVARSAGIPLIGFSNNASAASPGVYLLNVLPETEVKRSLTFALQRGRRHFAGIFPATDFGRAQETAFRQIAAPLGIIPAAIYNFTSESEARAIINQVAPQIRNGQIDALFLPDRGTAPSFGALLQQAGIGSSGLTLIGSADWEGDPTIRQSSALSGAIYPAVDEAGLQAISAEYQAKYGGKPHPLATIAYTATILANVNTLSMANPRYNATLLTAATGFNGRDGVFRFISNGRSEYALAIKQIGPGGPVQVDGPKL